MSNRNIRITAPSDTVISIVTKNGSVKGVLRFSTDFGTRRTELFRKAQKFVDSEVVRGCSARVPLQTGMLQKSGLLGTLIGSGLVSYIAPYSRAQYKTKPSRTYDPRRGGQWFERMKASEGKRILHAAAKIAGGRT